MINKFSKNIYFMRTLIAIGFLCFILTVFTYGSYYLEIKNSILRLGENKENLEFFSIYTSIWGTFGDFVGGTLNPILTFLSICLILYTVYQNKKSLDFNSEELALSRKAQQDTAKAQVLIQQTQSLQQFDSFFFSLLDQVKAYENEIYKNDRLNEIYKYLLVMVHTPNFNAVSELDKRYELNSYFLIVFELLKNIYEKIENNNFLDDSKQIARNYVNIIKVTMPFKFQQLLMLKVSESKEYRHYFVKYNFFDKTPFYKLDGVDGVLSLPIISLVYKFKNLYLEGMVVNGLDAFGTSKYLEEVRNSSVFGSFFELNNFQEVIINGVCLANEIVGSKNSLIAYFDDGIAIKEIKVNFGLNSLSIDFLNSLGEYQRNKFELNQLYFFNNYILLEKNELKIKLKFYINESKVVNVEQSYLHHDYVTASEIRFIN